MRTLSDFKNQGGVRVTPQVSPQMRFVAKCDKCNIELGDRVVSDTIKPNDYSQGQVEDIISDNNRRQNKARGRGMGDDTNIPAPQPPLKRRRFQFAKRKTCTSIPDSDNDNSNVPAALGQASLDKNSEQKYNELNNIDSRTSESSSNLNLTFPIFSRLKNGETSLSSKEKSSITKIKNRKPGKKLKGCTPPLPPTPKNLITSHFKPIASNSDVSDETESYVQRQEGEGESVLCILSRSLVTRPPS